MEESDCESVNYNNRRLALQWVVSSKQFILNPWNHAGAIKDKNFILSLAFFMADQEDDIIKMALEIGHLLLQNPKNFETLRSIEVFTMGYKLAYLTYKDSKKHQDFVSLISDVLARLKHPEREIRDRPGLQLDEQQDKAIWGDTTVRFSIPGLKPVNRDSVAGVVAQVPSVVSCNADAARKILTLTVRSGFSPALLKMTVAARLLLDINTMDPVTLDSTSVQFNESGDSEGEEGSLPPYFPEIDSPVKTSALAKMIPENIREKASGVVSWFQKSFYW